MTKKYKIIVRHESSDSFNSSIEETALTLEWDDLDVAKKNLQRIKAFNDYFDRAYMFNYMSIKNPADEEFKKTAQSSDWYVGENSLFTYSDEGDKITQSAFWRGWGERFMGARIEEDRSDWEI